MPKGPLWFVVDVAVALLLVFIAQNKLAHYEEQKKLQDQQINSQTLGVYAIVIDWDSKLDDDVDLYVQDPAGNIVFFQSKDVGLMHLERDDRGLVSDTSIGPDGQKIVAPYGEERVILRGAMPGEYVVNVHMYRMSDHQAPTQVLGRLIELNGGGKTITQQTVQLASQGDEKTMFRFSLSRSGDVVEGSINYLQKKFVGDASTHTPAQEGP